MTSKNKLATARKIAAPLIKKYEGLKLETYRDPAGILTIGYGHTGGAAYEGNIITPGQAETFLFSDMAEAQKPLQTLADRLNENQLAALTSFIYNIGGGAFLRSTLYRAILDDDPEKAANEFLRWNKATINGRKVELRGLTRRREAEKKLFETDPVKKK